MTENVSNQIWRAFYTRSRHELKASGRLVEQGIEVYCPTIKTKVRWKDRWKKVEKPLFTSYVFARVDEAERIRVLEDASIVCSVMYLGKPAMIRDEEIKAIQVLLSQADDVELRTYQPGAKVKVSHGALAGIEGVVIQQEGNRLRLRIEALGSEIIATVKTAAVITSTQ